MLGRMQDPTEHAFLSFFFGRAHTRLGLSMSARCYRRSRRLKASHAAARTRRTPACAKRSGHCCPVPYLRDILASLMP